jgi:hypothetical protein
MAVGSAVENRKIKWENGFYDTNKLQQLPTAIREFKCRIRRFYISTQTLLPDDSVRAGTTNYFHNC